MGGAATARPARVRARIRRCRPARPVRHARPRGVPDRGRAAPAQRRRVRRGLRECPFLAAGARRAARTACRTRRARGDVAGDAGARAREPRRPAAVGLQPRVRAGHLEAPAVRRGARRGGAAAEPAGHRAAPGRRGHRRVQRPRLGRASGLDLAELSRVLITGASGFAGRHLVAACRADGDEVIEAPRSRVADLRDAETALGVVAAARPDVVYHLAAQAHVGRSWEDPASTLTGNVAMTLNLLEAVRAEAPAAVFLLACSSEEYGPPLVVPTTEDELLKPANPYAVSKASCDLLGGLYAGAHGLRVIRARAFNHSGPGQEPVYAIASFARQIALGGDPVRVVTGNADTRRDYTDVRDVVRAYRLLAAHGEPGIFNVCSGVSFSAREVVAALGRVAGVDVVHEVDPARVRPNEVMEVRGSFTRLHEATGWQPSIAFEQTLLDTVSYWRATVRR